MMWDGKGSLCNQNISKAGIFNYRVRRWIKVEERQIGVLSKQPGKKDQPE